MTYIQPWQVRYYEVDQQGVVFNGWYLGWLDEALGGFLRHSGLPADLSSVGIGFQLVRAEIDWRRGVRWGDAVDIAVIPTKIGNTSFVVRYEVRSGGVVSAEAAIVYVSIAVDGSGKCPVPPRLREILGEASAEGAGSAVRAEDPVAS